MKKTAFVLSGGASLGSIQVGMLEALYELNIEADFLVGTSAGAINAAYIASRPQTAETASDLGAIWRGLRRNRVFPINPLTGVLGLLGARPYLVPDSGMRGLIGKHLKAERLEETEVPLHVIATDVLSGQEVRLSEGPLLEAVLASAAIPGVLPPVKWRGRPLIDGGVVNNVPLSHAVELGAKRIYVLPAGAACELDEPPRGALALLLYASGVVLGQRLVADMARVPADVELIVLPPPCPLTVQPTDFGQAAKLIEQSRALARRFLDAERSRRLPNEITRPLPDAA